MNVMTFMTQKSLIRKSRTFIEIPILPTSTESGGGSKMVYWLAAVSAEISGVIVSSMSSLEYAAIDVHCPNLSNGHKGHMACKPLEQYPPKTGIVARMIVY